MIEQELKDSTECKTGKLPRFISKLFYKDGSGDPLFAATYLKDIIGISTIPIVNNRGNRFNVLFYNAAGTHYLGPHLINYFENSKTSLNYTQNYILQMLRNKHVMVILRSFGIICYKIISPYWEKAAYEQSTAFEMGHLYNRLVDFLQECIDNPLLLVTNSIHLFHGPFQPVDEVHLSLFGPCEFDSLCIDISKRLCSLLNSKCKHLFKDFLEGGKYFNPSDSLIQCAKLCPPNNISVERLMAKLDSNLKSASMASVSTK